MSTIVFFIVIVVGFSLWVGVFSEVLNILKRVSLSTYKNNKNNVIFTELIRYETESVMLRTDINVRLLIPHNELDKHYTKLDK